MRRLLAAVALGALLLAASATAATAPNAGNQAALDRSVRYLQDVQNIDGGFGGAPGQASGSMFSAWVALALAAAGINPRDQKQPGGTDVFTYLVTHYGQAVTETECAPVACTTTLERELMVVNAAGASPHDFGGVDLAGELLARARPDGSFPHAPGGQPGVNDTIFAIFALAPVAEPFAREAVQRAAAWVEAAQHENGGWAWGVGGRDEVDMAGAAIQALAAAGRGRGEAVEEGLRYLRAAQNLDGGLPDFPGIEESNVASTAWATQAIWAVGENPEGWRAASAIEPLGYLESLQEPDGHIRWKRGQDLNGIWMTAYVLPAFAGQPWPIKPPPRSLPPVAPPTPGAGVIAGGGGRGAPLFSRPQPQSRGRTPGGARVLHSRDPVDHSRSRRGENTEQPSGTYGEEAGASSASPPPAEEEDAAAASTGGTGSAAGEAAARALAGEGESRDGDGSGGGTGAVTGLLVGDSGEPVGGAPGLRAAADQETGPGAALAIGAAALLAGLAGVWLERRRPWVLRGVPA